MDVEWKIWKNINEECKIFIMKIREKMCLWKNGSFNYKLEGLKSNLDCYEWNDEWIKFLKIYPK